MAEERIARVRAIVKELARHEQERADPKGFHKPIARLEHIILRQLVLWCDGWRYDAMKLLPWVFQERLWDLELYTTRETLLYGCKEGEENSGMAVTWRTIIIYDSKAGKEFVAGRKIFNVAFPENTTDIC